jgi:hypothetical protein
MTVLTLDEQSSGVSTIDHPATPGVCRDGERRLHGRLESEILDYRLEDDGEAGTGTARPPAPRSTRALPHPGTVLSGTGVGRKARQLNLEATASRTWGTWGRARKGSGRKHQSAAEPSRAAVNGSRCGRERVLTGRSGCGSRRTQRCSLPGMRNTCPG